MVGFLSGSLVSEAAVKQYTFTAEEEIPGHSHPLLPLYIWLKILTSLVMVSNLVLDFL